MDKYNKSIIVRFPKFVNTASDNILDSIIDVYNGGASMSPSVATMS